MALHGSLAVSRCDVLGSHLCLSPVLRLMRVNEAGAIAVEGPSVLFCRLCGMHLPTQICAWVTQSCKRHLCH